MTAAFFLIPGRVPHRPPDIKVGKTGIIITHKLIKAGKTVIIINTRVKQGL